MFKRMRQNGYINFSLMSLNK